MKLGAVLVLAALGPGLAAGARADPAAAASEPAANWSLRRHLRESPQLLGGPDGWRSQLERRGLSVWMFYNQTLSWKPAGGAEPGSTGGHSGSYDFFALAHAEESIGWPGLDLLLHVKGFYDRNVNADVGALGDPIDDADFDQPAYVSELWAQQAILDDRVRLRVGFLEQQTLFDRNLYANSEDRQFLNTFLDNNAVVPLSNGLGAALLLAPVPWAELALGVVDTDNVITRSGFDTTFDGFDSLSGYAELALRAKLPGREGGLSGSYRVGVFLDGREKRVFGRPARSERGHVGVYLNFDQQVLREAGAWDQGLGLFGRFGAADEDVNRIAWFWSVGLEYRGLLPGRGADVLGLGSYQAIGSDRFRDRVDPDFDRETGIELYYRIAVLPWLDVTPDAQFILDPGARGTARNAWVFSLRLRVHF